VHFFAFGVGSTAGFSFFELLMESKAIFMLSRVWSTTGLLNVGDVDYSLVERNRSRDKACNGTDIGIGIPVELTSLVMRVKGLFNSRGQ
jgi:hypothetical protein